MKALLAAEWLRSLANGKKEIFDVQINEEVVDPDDVEMLQDLILAAINDVIKASGRKNERNDGTIYERIKFPGLF